MGTWACNPHARHGFNCRFWDNRDLEQHSGFFDLSSGCHAGNDGTQLRKVAVPSANGGGDYVAENTTYDLTTLGFSATSKVVTLYVEGISAGADRACSIVVRAAAADKYGDFGAFSEIAKVEATVRAAP